MVRPELVERVAAVRRFNRFYTQTIGVLHEGLLGSPFSLTEVRVLYELAHHERLTASALCKELGLDAGYLSRILRGFEKRGLLEKSPSQADGRQSELALTAVGREAFAPLNAQSSKEIADLLGRLPEAEQGSLLEAMRTIEGLLGPRSPSTEPYVLRAPEPGDLGWVVERHGVLYAQEYGWDERFEALVAEIVGRYGQTHDPKTERCWIAEREGRRVGSVFLVRRSRTVAQLRCLLVEPSARGLGIGGRLTEECIRFARKVGYRKMVLWTNSVLFAARRIYERAGFRLVKQEPHESFGEGLVAETWELKL